MAQDLYDAIERNTNANIIQYDAQIGNDGKLNARNPVVGYWIRLAGERYRALADIDGSLAYLHTIYIRAHGKGASTKVEYIELRGIDTDTGTARYERFTP